MLEFRKSSRPDSARGRRPSVDGFVRRGSPTPMQAQKSDSAEKPDSSTNHYSGTTDSFHSRPFPAQSQATLPPITPHPSLTEPRKATDERRKKKSFKKSLKIAMTGFGALLVCFTLVGGFVFGKAWLAAHKIFQGGGDSAVLFNTEVKPELLKGEGDGRVNILLVGIGGGGRAGANLTDSMVIASIDPIAKDIALLSIPRDLWVKVPDFWSMKINAAYSSAYERALDNGVEEKDAMNAGFETLDNTVEQYMGIPIHYHALVNFQAFKEGIDAVGGIDVSVEEDLYDSMLASENNGNPLLFKAGLQHMDGREALLYAQSRYSSSDFARGQRQRQILIALKDKVLASGTFSNPNTVSKLIDALGDNVSINATLGEIMRMYEITKDVPSTSIATVGFTDEPNVLVKTGTINDQSVVLPVAGESDFSQIQAFVRNTLRDPFLKSENATIAVLNGTEESGLATKKANELKSYGYNVIIVDDAPTKDYVTTVIYDRTNGVKKYTQNYLEKRLGTSVSAEPSSTNPILAVADFIVVLGSNETSTSSN